MELFCCQSYHLQHQLQPPLQLLHQLKKVMKRILTQMQMLPLPPKLKPMPPLSRSKFDG